MKAKNKLKAVLLLFFGIFISCEDYLEVEAPDHKIGSATVFNNDPAALSALTGVYNQLASVNYSGGGGTSVTVLGALSADVLSPKSSTNLPYTEFEEHELLPNNNRNLNLWSSAYNIIYMTNSLLEGVEASQNLSEQVRIQIEGQASFVRAFTYFYLVNLYGQVPLILTTDYRENSLAQRNSVEQVYEQIIVDLQTAIDFLNSDYPTGERTVVTQNAAVALLARVHLYQSNWQQAELYSTQVIEQTGTYEILEDLNSVFLANSREAIWQISPKGRGYSLTNTEEGAAFIIHPWFYFLAQFKLEPDFVDSFYPDDKRFENWIGYHQPTTYYYPFKYKIQNSTEEPTEYSMVLRLAEQYLIRAEARAMLNDLPGAITDLDVIRERAGLPLLADTNPTIGKDKLLDLILEERKKELFTEWGHRWLDLKRTGKANEIFGNDPLWQETDLLYPIPEEERLKNPDLTQNNGY